MPNKEDLIQENEQLQEVLINIHETLSSLFEYINDHIEIEDEDDVDDAEFEIEDEEDEDEEEECDFCGK